MSLPPVANRMQSVGRVRAHQRAWIEQTRRSVDAGGPFAICNGDEAEELFLAMGVPVLAINYWNFLIAAQQSAPHFTEVLHRRGYPGPHFFALGLASSMAPEKAPWGGLPKPTIICGSSRSEAERRVTELWSRETGAHWFPLEFSFPSEDLRGLPADWWNYTRDRWQELIDPDRLDFRVEQERALIGFLEQTTGRSFSLADLGRAMALVNEQMDHWIAARQLIGRTRPCPVHVRDQMSMYQAMWHRGSEVGVSLVKDYRDEVAQRVRDAVAGAEAERIRIYYSGDVPPWSQFAEDELGIVTVANFYSAVPDLYARTVFDDDPLRALAGRHLFLFAFNAERIAYVAREFDCDAAVVVEPYMDRYPPELSSERQAVEAAGVPYLALPREADDEDIRARLRAFVSERFG
jgi:hypothetical protein